MNSSIGLIVIYVVSLSLATQLHLRQIVKFIPVINTIAVVCAFFKLRRFGHEWSTLKKVKPIEIQSVKNVHGSIESYTGLEKLFLSVGYGSGFRNFLKNLNFANKKATAALWGTVTLG